MGPDSLWIQNLIGVVMSFVLLDLNKGANQEADKNPFGFFELKMHKAYYMTGPFSITIGGLLLMFSSFYNEDTDTWLIIALFLFFVILGGLCIIYARNHRVLVNEESLIVYDWRGRKRTIGWDRIEKISFNSFSGYIKVRGHHQKVCIHQHLIGLKAFVDHMEKHTEWTAARLRLPVK